ncbi:MAG: hypothetical protein ACRCTZ_03320 [Sarcina sp.]
MKKYLNKKLILLIIALIYVFFTGFKFLKGKSFFDTIVEYTNNIYSINAEIVDATRDNYSLLNFEYIPIKYTDYQEGCFGKYIVRKENTNNLYIYEPLTREEELFVEIDKEVNLHDVVVENNWVIWLESNKGSKGREWRIYAKLINSNSKNLIEEGVIVNKESENYINFIPREFKVEDNFLIYTKYSENIIDNNNIITATIMTDIIKYDLEKKEGLKIATSYNNYKEELSDIQIDNNQIIWKKKYKDIKTGEITKAEIYKYSIIDGSIENIFETRDIYRSDIKGDNIAIVAKNPEDNILIYNTKEKSFINIFYKGSRIEKLFRRNEEIPVIIDIEFITDEKLFIGISSQEESIAAVIYDLKLEQFLNFNDEILKEDVSLIQYGVSKDKLLAYVGIVDKNIFNEEEKDLYNAQDDVELYKNNQKEVFVDLEGININLDEANEGFNENGLYYKYFEYLLR